MDIPPDVVQAVAGFRLPRIFKRGIPRKYSPLHQWSVYVVGNDDDNIAWVPVWYCTIKGCRDAKFDVKCTKETTSKCNKHQYRSNKYCVLFGTNNIDTRNFLV